jgi:hypothetical protein
MYPLCLAPANLVAFDEIEKRLNRFERIVDGISTAGAPANRRSAPDLSANENWSSTRKHRQKSF